jgi:protease-4
MYAAGLWNKLGLSHDEIHTSQNATMFTTTHDYNDTEWRRFEAWLDRVYVDFTSKVAEGRHLPKEKVLEIAKGRIWTGEDAKAIGLVDELGGFDTAVQAVKKSINVADGDDINLKVFPKRKKVYELLLPRAAESSENDASAQALAAMFQSVQPVAQKLRALGVSADDDSSQDRGENVLMMQEIEAQR